MFIRVHQDRPITMSSGTIHISIRMSYNVWHISYVTRTFDVRGLFPFLRLRTTHIWLRLGQGIT